jgi:hydrogenase nickel incorporation protein HypA/HybF
MHEFSICKSLIEIIEKEAMPYGGAKVVTVRLRIGELSGVVPNALRFAFEVLSKGGITEGASLLIEDVPLEIYCRACKTAATVDEPFLICPHCQSSEVEMIGGRELEIREMEIEDVDQGSQKHSS